MVKKKNSVMSGMMRDSLLMTGAGVTMGVGAGVVHSAGGNAAGITAMSNMMPVTGTIVGGGHALKMLKGFGKWLRKEH